MKSANAVLVPLSEPTPFPSTILASAGLGGLLPNAVSVNWTWVREFTEGIWRQHTMKV